MMAIVLAGGLGTRLRGIIKKCPKPMAPIHGRPFLEYLLDYWQKQGIRRFILCVGYRRETIQKHFGSRYGRARIDYSVEKKPLGTGGALLQALAWRKIGQNFLVLNGDTFFEVPLRRLARFHARSKADTTLALLRKSGRRYERLQCGKGGRITALEPRGLRSAPGWINGGVYLFNRRALKGCYAKGKTSLESDVLPQLLKKGMRLYGCGVNGRFIDIGTPASYKTAAKFLGSKEI